MENASKALIIAGAILLAILIISLGIMIYNQAAGVVNNNAMSEVEITQYNSKFTQYEGKSVKGSTVRSMLQIVYTHNLSQDSSDRKLGVGKTKTTYEYLSLSASPDTDGIPTGATYEVKCDYNTKGLVNHITVVQK